MIVCLLKNNYISSIELPNKVQGQYWLRDESTKEKRNVIAIEGIGENWVLKGNKEVFFKDNSSSTLLERGNIYALTNKDNDAIFAYIEDEYEDTYFLKYKLKYDDEIISIGRNEGNTICIHNPAISGRHLDLIYHNKKWVLQDNGSTNGTFVNYHKVSKCDLNIGDIVYVLGVKIIIGDKFICINKNYSININENELEIVHFESYVSDEEFEESDINYFYRSPRIKKDIQLKKLTIDSPPSSPIQEEMPLMLVLGPSITMGMASLSTAFFAISNAMSNGDISSAAPSIVMSLSMLLGTVMWPILSKNYEKKNKTEKEKQRQEKYGRYLDKKEKEIEACAKEQIEIWNENFPNINECISKIEKRDRTLFERNMLHNDFLELRVGLGKRKVKINVQYSKKSFSMTEDSLVERLYRICDNDKIIDNVPITISLKKYNVLGIVGDTEATKRLLKNLLIQIFAYYSYEDVKLIFLYDENNIDYEYVKWLPHVFDNKKENRFIARNITELKELSSYFEGIISKREEMNEQDLEDEMPYYVFISLDNKLSAKANFIKRISKSKKDLHCSIVHITEELKDLSSDCKSVVEIQKRSAQYYDLNDMTGNKTYFIPDQENPDLNDICLKLANIPLDLTEEDNNLPNMVTFLQMYNVGKIEHLNALNRWKENDPTVSLEAPVGVDNLGALFNLDLHQKYHGPHGLVAGMTGSGKSEFIMTYILSLAINYHPYEVSFILIDYKGGGMAKAFENLPHTCGIITNLDGSSVKRSLISIESELKRRQSIFADVSKQLNVSNLDIYKYQSLFRNGQVTEPLQHLFIISDEFAELKTQQPEFMEQLVSAARIGRSLGIHLILATQKPSGVVDDQIWSNSRFRICLKVQERADSIDMLKRPDAAEISQTGRFYLQVGYNELFELGQSAWAGAPYYPSDRPIIEKDSDVTLIDINGHPIQSVRIDRRKQLFGNANKQLDEITDYLCHIAEEENIKVKPLWLDPIPELIYIDELMNKYQYQQNPSYMINPIIGEYDDPARQRQDLLTLSISQGGNTILYGVNGSGKTTLMNTIIYSLTRQYTAQQVQLYVLDFASETLKAFENAPQVGEVLLSYEEEKITNLLRMLNKELSARKKEFASYGGDIISYNEESGHHTHSIIVMINNFLAFLETYEDYEDIITYLSREGARYGIYFIITATASTGIRFRILQNFSQNVCLQMNDDADYISIIGKTDGLYPMRVKGRGLIRINEDVFEFQTAHISKEMTTFKEIKAYCQKLQLQSTIFARNVPILPDIVTKEFIQQYHTHEYLKLPIGIDAISLEPMYYSFDDEYLNFIITDNIHDFIKPLIGIMPKDKDIYVLDSHKILGEIPNVHIAQNTDGLKNSIDQLFDIVLYRNNTYKLANSIQEVQDTFEDIIIVIPSLYDLLGSFDGETNEKLELLLEKGKTEYKMNILIAESQRNIGSLSHMNWFKENANSDDVIWYSSGISDQYVFNVSSKGNDLYEELPEMFGYVVKKRNYRKIKMLSQKENTEEEI